MGSTVISQQAGLGFELMADWELSLWSLHVIPVLCLGFHWVYWFLPIGI